SRFLKSGTGTQTLACTHHSPRGIAAQEAALPPPCWLCRSSQTFSPRCPDRSRICFSNTRSSKPVPVARRACRRPARKFAPSRDSLRKGRSNLPTQSLFARDRGLHAHTE